MIVHPPFDGVQQGGFAMKAAAFPLNFWLPASYHTPRIVVSALFAGLLKILPVFFMVLPGAVGYLLFRDQIGSQATKTLPIMMLTAKGA